MRIAVTGGAGFIGSHIVDRLVSEGHDVLAVDNLEPQVHRGKKPAYLNPKAQYIFGDYVQKDALSRILASDVIFHDAASVGVGQSMYEIERYIDNNTLKTGKLLQALVTGKHDVRKLIVASSMSIYGEGSYECPSCGIVHPRLRSPQQMKAGDWEMRCPSCGKRSKPVPTGEEKPLQPTSIYAVTKRDQEEMCLSIGRAYGIPTVALRYFNVYGPRQSLSNPYTGVCAIFSSMIKNDNPPLIFEDGGQTRDFVSVHDIVQANVIAMKEKRADYGYFNVGTGEPVSILSVAETLTKLYGKKSRPAIAGKSRQGDIRHAYADIGKIAKLGYKPSVSFDDGMKELVSWGEKTAADDRVSSARRELEEKGLIS